MKFIKFGAFALALGLFAASCNEETETTTTTVDSAAAAAPQPMAPAATVVDPATAAPGDTTKISTETKMEDGQVKTETEVKTEKK